MQFKAPTRAHCRLCRVVAQLINGTGCACERALSSCSAALRWGLARKCLMCSALAPRGTGSYWTRPPSLLPSLRAAVPGLTPLDISKAQRGYQLREKAVGGQT